MGEYKLINTHVFHPAAKDVRARCEKTFCCNTDNCDFYKRNECVHHSLILSEISCPYGKRSISSGYTKHAQTFYLWMEDARKQNEKTLDKINFKTDKMGKVGDYVFLPYPYLKNYRNTLEDIENEHFIKISTFDVKKVKEIYDFRPQALFGGEIKEFQEKWVSRFLQHLREVFPALYEDLKKAYPDISPLIEKQIENYIGREAYIGTLNEGSIVIDCHRNQWKISNGEIICEKWSTWLPFGRTPTEVRIKITDDMKTKITDNNQVNQNTVFVD